jgi:hypothetical protein
MNQYFVRLNAVIAIGVVMSFTAKSATVAYWRFEAGPMYTAVLHPVGDGAYYQSVEDISGNGNHLSVWSQGGGGGYAYRTDLAVPVMPRIGAVNNFSVKNTGASPTMFTKSSDSSPSGYDIENITFSVFTIEAFFKPEAGGYRTIVGRDARNVVSADGKLPALYFKIRPDNGVVVEFADVAGYWHSAASASGLIQGFDWASDNEGLTGKWYYMAAVSDGATLSLYLANMTDGVLQLVAQTNIGGSPNTALAKGTVSGSDWHVGGWSVGRGLYDGQHTDRAYGFIDEVRISNSALPMHQFLFAVNPIMIGADPDTLLVENTAWMYTTSVNLTQLFAYSSTNLTNWQSHGTILDFSIIPWIPAGKLPWAPGITKKNGVYYLYYSVGPKPSHIGVAYSSSPAGPFIDSGRPLLSDNGAPDFEAIDAMVFTDPQSQSGQSYLYAGGSAGSKLRVFKLNEDMKSFAGEMTVATPTNYTEAPFMHYRNGIYYLSYSHGVWSNDTYSVHYATSNTPYGPWNYRGAILVSNSRHKGPGHHSFMYNEAMQEWYIFYHRWNNGYPSEGRMIAIEKLQYEQDGRIKPIAMTDRGIGPVVLQGTSRADFNNNGVIDFQDMKYLAGEWLTSTATADIAPASGDGIVDFMDFACFASQWP